MINTKSSTNNFIERNISLICLTTPVQSKSCFGVYVVTISNINSGFNDTVKGAKLINYIIILNFNI